jgi:hypothetical protein
MSDYQDLDDPLTFRSLDNVSNRYTFSILSKIVIDSKLSFSSIFRMLNGNSSLYLKQGVFNDNGVDMLNLYLKQGVFMKYGFYKSYYS